jgi:two-component system sensor histidine kinase KdpD
LFKLDAGLIEEIIQNLIITRYSTPKKTQYKIELYIKMTVVFSVSDSGNGFPENEIQFAFEKFYRIPNTKTDGSGLGLSIVKVL